MALSLVAVAQHVQPMRSAQRLYECTNHLGNVAQVVADRCHLVGTSVTNQQLRPGVISAIDYAPFGSALAARASAQQPYRFGFGSQENTDELSGPGNHTTARYWEYDTRLGRRWNQDPKPNPSMSNYATFSNNPIVYTDLLGDTVKVGTETENDAGFQAWKNSRAGQRFYKRYGIGGKREHITVEIDVVDEVKDADGDAAGSSGVTQTIVHGENGSKHLTTQEWYDKKVAAGEDVSNYTTTIGENDRVSFRIQVEVSADKIDLGSSILHETQHVRLQDFTYKKYGKPLLYNSTDQHIAMLNNYRKPGRYTLKYHKRWAMRKGNGIYDFNAERWEYYDEHRLPGETDADIDRKAYKSGESNLFMLH